MKSKPKQRKPKRTITGYRTFRGHPTISYDVAGRGEEICYASDGVPTPGHGNPEGIERPCVLCGRVAGPPDPESWDAYGPDPCLGMLPSVDSACCGHGVKEPYVRVTARGEDALRLFRNFGVGPPAQPARHESDPDAPSSPDAAPRTTKRS